MLWAGSEVSVPHRVAFTSARPHVPRCGMSRPTCSAVTERITSLQNETSRPWLAVLGSPIVRLQVRGSWPCTVNQTPPCICSQALREAALLGLLPWGAGPHAPGQQESRPGSRTPCAHLHPVCPLPWRRPRRCAAQGVRQACISSWSATHARLAKAEGSVGAELPAQPGPSSFLALGRPPRQALHTAVSPS